MPTSTKTELVELTYYRLRVEVLSFYYGRLKKRDYAR
jgi:hypothetical protein